MMSRLDGIRHKLRTLLHPGAYAQDLRDEMEYHRELDARQGHAAHEARRRLGNETYYREEARRFTWLGSLDIWRQDATYAWRSIRRTPGVTVMIIMTLALGLGVNAATFSVLDRLYLREPSGVADPNDVRKVWIEHSPLRMADGKAFLTESSTYPLFKAVVSATTTPDAFAIYDTDFSLYMGSGANRTRVRAVFASASYFDVLGVRAGFGRVYTSAEDSLGNGAPVIVLSDRFWHAAFGADSAVIGKQIRVEGDEYRVIGILPATFTGLDLQAVDAWIPLASIPRAHWIVQGAGKGRVWWERDRASGFNVIYRASAVGPGLDQKATASVRAMQRQEQYGDTLMHVFTSGLVGAGPAGAGRATLISARLIGLSFIVLIIACANVINLLLARAVKRKREIAVRLALGITRARLVRLLTTETMLLALIAGVVATLFAWGGGSLLRSLVLPEVVWYDSPLHSRVVLFALGLSAVAGLVAGVVPAVQASNPVLTPSLKDGSRDSGVHKSTLRRGLLITQAALSVVLLVGAALFMRSLDNVRSLHLGYDIDRLAFGEVGFEAGQRPPTATVAAEMDRLARRFEGIPGVESVARTELAPMRGLSFAKFYWGTDSSSSLKKKFPTYIAVSPSFFRTTGMRMLRGEEFKTGDGAPRQLVVNAAMASVVWPDRGAIGQCVRFERPDAECYTVSGVVENARQGYVIEDAKPMYYMPLGNLPDGRISGTTLVVRTSPAAMAAVSAALRTELRRSFPNADLRVRTMVQELEPEYRPWRLGALLFTSMGLLALLVAVIGIYSAVAYDVTQRTHEFGVRIALGAQITTVVRQVVEEGVKVVAIGVIAGVVLALAAGKLVAALLYGVSPRDPSTMLLVSATLLIVAGLAAAVPAWRAARVDPIRALRAE